MQFELLLLLFLICFYVVSSNKLFSKQLIMFVIASFIFAIGFSALGEYTAFINHERQKEIQLQQAIEEFNQLRAQIAKAKQTNHIIDQPQDLNESHSESSSKPITYSEIRLKYK